MKFLAPALLSLAACGSTETPNTQNNGVEPKPLLTVRELKARGLVELDRFKAIGATGPARTGLIPVLVLGPPGTEKVFDSKRQFMCEVIQGVSEDDLNCYPRASVIRG